MYSYVIIFSEEDYDAFCLAYMFTYRDFEMGTLGLAWTGDLKNAGGVCEKNGVSILYNYSKINRSPASQHQNNPLAFTSCACVEKYILPGSSTQNVPFNIHTPVITTERSSSINILRLHCREDRKLVSQLSEWS